MVRVALSVLRADSPIRRRLNQPGFNSIQPDHAKSESQIRKSAKRLTDRDGGRISRTQSDLRVVENVELKEMHRTPVFEMGADVGTPPPCRRRHTSSRSPSNQKTAIFEPVFADPDIVETTSQTLMRPLNSRSPSNQKTAIFEPSFANSDIVETNSQTLMRPLNSRRRFPNRTPSLTALQVQAEQIQTEPIGRLKVSKQVCKIGQKGYLDQAENLRKWLNLLKVNHLRFPKRIFG
jgi:hypothetical protein